MNRKKIDVYDNLTEIVKELKEGVLLTAKADDQVNSMTISWGMLGIEWGRPVFVTFLREHRFTKELIDKNGEFTVNIPYGQDAKDILNFCGTKSGRDVDKFQELGLTPVEAEKISVPAIRELPLTLECKVVYKQEQDPDQISEKRKKIFYPEDVDGSFHGANRDYHTAYYGQILSAYILED